MKIILFKWEENVTFTRDELNRFINYISSQDNRLIGVKVYPKYAYFEKRHELALLALNIYNIGSSALKVKATFKNGTVLIEYIERKKAISAEIKNISDFTE